MTTLLFFDVPKIVFDVFAEHLALLSGFECLAQDSGVVDAAAAAPDLVVAGKDGARALFPGVPVLTADWARPQRLGALLKQIARALAEPVFAIEDFFIGPLLFSARDRLLRREDGGEIPLTDREVGLLVRLARHHGRAVPREDLLREVWRYHDDVDTHTLETHIYRLRGKLEKTPDAPSWLLTRGSGYLLRLTPDGAPP